jgi:hypothetical protein
VKFTTYQPTTQPGICALCVEKDIAALSAVDFDTARMVTPNVTFPFRIPKAELDYLYDGPDLFYTLDNTTSASVAQSRQQVQAVLEGYDPLPPATALLMGYLEIEFIVDFFEPVAPSALIGTTEVERRALAFVRSQFAKPRPHVVQPKVPTIEDIQSLIRSSSAAACAASCASSAQNSLFYP